MIDILQTNYYHRSKTASVKVTEFFNNYCNQNNSAIIFVSGWASTYYTWRYVIPELSELFRVFYFESREKATAKVDNNASFYMSDMKDDLVSFINCNFSDKPFVLIGSSLGATTILESWHSFENKPEKIVLITPNIKMPFPSILSIAFFIPDLIVEVLRPIIFAYVNARKQKLDKKQVAGMNEVINRGNLPRIKSSIKDLWNYNFNLKLLTTINTPCLLITASEDRVHSHQDSQIILSKLPNSEYVNLKTFSTTHSQTIVSILKEWIK
ncbi:MAG: alpha/beta hydrolase [Cyanobacteria bacterium P01_H01_bin.35]